MHPMMIFALAGEVERERQHDRYTARLRSLAAAHRAQGFAARPAFPAVGLRPGTEERRI
jgi:hypothetical protein